MVKGSKMNRSMRGAARLLVLILAIAFAAGPLLGNVRSGAAEESTPSSESALTEENGMGDPTETPATIDETETPSATETNVPTETPTIEATESPTATETETVQPSETASPTATESAAPVNTATATPTPTKTPEVQPAGLSPVLTLSNSVGVVGQTITLNFSNWQPGTRGVLLDRVKIGEVIIATNGSGSFSYVIPTIKGGAHIFGALSNGVRVEKTFIVKPSMTVTPASISAGKVLQVSVKGFAAGETVKFRLYDTATSSSYKQLGTFVVNSTGVGTASFTIPSNATVGAHKIAAVGGTYSAVGQITVLAAPSISISGSPAQIGGVITITLKNFQPGSRGIVIDGVVVGQIYVNSNRQGSGTYEVPVIKGGSHEVKAKSDGVWYYKNFTVKPSIYLGAYAAYPGGTLTFYVEGFGARETVKFRLYNSTTSSSYSTLGTFQVGNDGTTTRTVTIPYGAALTDRKIAVVGATYSAISYITINPDDTYLDVRITVDDGVACSYSYYCSENVTICLVGAAAAYVGDFYLNTVNPSTGNDSLVAYSDWEDEYFLISDFFSASQPCRVFTLWATTTHYGSASLVIWVDNFLDPSTWPYYYSPTVTFLPS
jgi:hypothetical protein